MLRINTDALRGDLAEMKANSTVALQILQVCQDAERSADELAAAVEPDPSISIRVLRLANSPIYAATREITSLNEAVARIGRENTQSIAVTAALGADDESLCPPDYWDNAMATAATTRLAAEIRCQPVPQAFSCGLLLDVGSFLMYRHGPAEYSAILEEADATTNPLTQLETEQVGIAHPTVGAIGLRDLGLPDELCAAIEHHHKPPHLDATELETCAFLGAVLADFHSSGDVHPVQRAVAERSLGWGLDELRTRVEDEIDSVRSSAVGA